MREISHKLAFAHNSEAPRYSDVFNPNDGQVQARVAWATAPSSTAR